MPVAARTGAAGLTYLAGDQQGTEETAIDATTLAVTRRYFDPYGNAIGTPPASWPAGQKGFVNGTADPNASTGLTDLGAREYQATTASFISPDPILDTSNPQDLNPYAYSFDNPATDSDPTGQSAKSGTAEIVVENGQPCIQLNGGKPICIPLPGCSLGRSKQVQDWIDQMGKKFIGWLKEIGWKGVLSVIGFSLCLLPEVGVLTCMVIEDSEKVVDKISDIADNGLTKKDLIELGEEFAQNALGALADKGTDIIWDGAAEKIKAIFGPIAVKDLPLMHEVFNYVLAMEKKTMNCDTQSNPNNLVGFCSATKQK